MGHDLWARRRALAQPITCSIVFISRCASSMSLRPPGAGRTPRRATARSLADAIEHIRWRLWHGQVQRALDLIGDTLVRLDVAAETASLHAASAGKVAGVLRGLETYVSGRSSLIIDYATARRNFFLKDTATTESTVQRLLHRRMSANQQMRWSPRGAHLMLKVRTAVVNGTFNNDHTTAERWARRPFRHAA